MSRTRTFIAVEIGKSIADQAVRLQEALTKSGAEVRWVVPESMHVTLLFLGEVDDRDLHSICKAVKDVAATEPPFTLEVSGIGAFPNTRRPKIIWAGIREGADALQRIYAGLEARMLDLGFYRKEERGYTPHITLGRVKGEADSSTLAPELAKRATWSGGRVQIEKVNVFSSELERSGPIYNVIGHGDLKVI